MAKRRGASDILDDYVPKSNDDLYHMYGSFVARLVTRYNRVSSNYEDLLQHVWYKLVEVDIIAKYHRAGGSLPKKLTALQSCAFLQITWIQFKKILHRHRVGDNRHLDRVRGVSKDLRTKIFERDHGICACCGRDMHHFQQVVEIGRANPEKHTTISTGARVTHAELIRALGISPKQRIFWYTEKTSRAPRKGDHTLAYRTICFLCWNQRNSSLPKSKSIWAPTPIQGTWASKKAVYAREDIERLKAIRESRSDRCRTHAEIDPSILTTKGFFKVYLARAVHNIYCNWCRTRDRRYKEHCPGVDEWGNPWEESLEDQSVSHQEDLLALYEASKIIAYNDRNAEGDSKVHERVLVLAADGRSLSEIVQELSLPSSGLAALQEG